VDKERVIRLDITEVQEILRAAGKIGDNDYLLEGHIEPGELILKILTSEDVKQC